MVSRGTFSLAGHKGCAGMLPFLHHIALNDEAAAASERISGLFLRCSKGRNGSCRCALCVICYFVPNGETSAAFIVVTTCASFAVIVVLTGFTVVVVFSAAMVAMVAAAAGVQRCTTMLEPL